MPTYSICGWMESFLLGEMRRGLYGDR